jgi:hypothetical protein
MVAGMLKGETSFLDALDVEVSLVIAVWSMHIGYYWVYWPMLSPGRIRKSDTFSFPLEPLNP